MSEENLHAFQLHGGHYLRLPNKKTRFQAESGLFEKRKRRRIKVSVVGSRRENIHDAVEILDAGKLDAYLALSDAQRDLDIGIEAVG